MTWNVAKYVPLAAAISSSTVALPSSLGVVRTLVMRALLSTNDSSGSESPLSPGNPPSAAYAPTSSPRLSASIYRRTTATAGVAGTAATVCELGVALAGFASGGRVAGGAGERLRAGVATLAGAELGTIVGAIAGEGRSLGATLAAELGRALGVGDALGSRVGEGKSLGVGSGEGVMRATIVAMTSGFF